MRQYFMTTIFNFNTGFLGSSKQLKTSFIQKALHCEKSTEEEMGHFTWAMFGQHDTSII